MNEVANLALLDGSWEEAALFLGDIQTGTGAFEAFEAFSYFMFCVSKHLE